jgi:cellobiose-specific phosphotransferase system component IIB
MSWSEGVIEAIKDTKKTILKKKVILNIIIESYSWYDRIFRYSHMTIALVAPLISFLDQMINNTVENTSTAVLVLSSIVAGMIKLKDYLKFDKLKDQAKQQTIKYQQLYQRIEREMRKTESIRQNGEEFISWITRELSIIEVDDPDLPQSLKEKYIQLCKARGIPYDEDLEALGELFAAKVQIVVENVVDQYAVDQTLKMHVQQPINMQEDPHNDQKDPHVDQKDPNIDHKAMYKTLRKQRSPSDEADRQEYREKVKTLDTAQDLNWAIERLNGLQ